MQQLIRGALFIMLCGWSLLCLGNVPPVERSQSHPAKCPDFTIECPPDVVAAGQTAVFKVSGLENKDRYTYKWTTSAGRITSGQGTSSISIEMPDLGGGRWW